MKIMTFLLIIRYLLFLFILNHKNKEKNNYRTNNLKNKKKERMSLLTKDLNISYHLNKPNMFQTPTQKNNYIGEPHI